MYSRTDHFDCGHTYTVDENGRDLKIANCPVCERDNPTQVGKYLYSKVLDDEPDPPKHKTIGADFGNGRTVEVRANPDGTYGTPIIQPSPDFRSMYSNVVTQFQTPTGYYDIETNAPTGSASANVFAVSATAAHP